jgi:hypothetical protein
MLDCMAHLFRPVSATCAFLPLDGARFAARPGHFGPTDERGKSTQKGDDVPLMANRGWPVAAEKNGWIPGLLIILVRPNPQLL